MKEEKKKSERNSDAYEFAAKTYGTLRNQNLTYMMHKLADARAEARRAKLREAPRFCLRRAERIVRWP